MFLIIRVPNDLQEFVDTLLAVVT